MFSGYSFSVNVILKGICENKKNKSNLSTLRGFQKNFFLCKISILCYNVITCFQLKCHWRHSQVPRYPFWRHSSVKNNEKPFNVYAKWSTLQKNLSLFKEKKFIVLRYINKIYQCYRTLSYNRLLLLWKFTFNVVYQI